MWRLQGGSYIPGFSRQAYGAGLQRDVTKTLKDQAKKASLLNKYMSKRGALGKWGGILAGAAAGALLTPVLGPGGVMVGKALASGLGSAAGSSKFLSGEGPSMKPGAGTGLLGSGYEQLGEAKGGIDEAMRGQAYGAGAASLASGLTGMAGDKLGKSLAAGSGSGNLGLSAAPTSLTGGRPTLPLPTTPTSIAGRESGLTGLNFNQPESLGDIPSLHNFFNQQGEDITSSGILDTGTYLPEGNRFHNFFNQQGGYMQGYQEGGDVDKDNLKSLLGLMDDAKWEASHSGTTGDYWGQGKTTDYYLGDKLEQLEPLKNPFKDIDLPPDDIEDTPWQGILRDFPAPWSAEEQKVKDMGGRTFGDYEKSMNRAMSMFPEAYQDKPESKSWLQRLLGRQMGGMMPGGVSNALPYKQGGSISPYNLGGSVTQQPMAYQLGGLLKYKRSPMMG